MNEFRVQLIEDATQTKLDLRFRARESDLAQRWLAALQVRADAQDKLLSKNLITQRQVFSVFHQPFERYDLEPNDFKQFQFRQEPGCVYLTHGLMAPSLFRSLEEGLVPRPIQHFTSNFEMYFGESKGFEDWPALSRFLYEHGLDMTDPQLGLGQIPIADLIGYAPEASELERFDRVSSVQIDKRVRLRKPLEFSGPLKRPEIGILLMTLSADDVEHEVRFAIDDSAPARKWLRLMNEELTQNAKICSQLIGFCLGQDLRTELDDTLRALRERGVEIGDDLSKLTHQQRGADSEIRALASQALSLLARQEQSTREWNHGRVHIDFEYGSVESLELDDFRHFSTKRTRGELLLSYGGAGVSTLNAFWRGQVSEPDPQTKLSAGVVVNLNDDAPFYQQRELEEWLQRFSTREPSSLEWAIGEIPLGQVMLDGRTLDEIAALFRSSGGPSKLRLISRLNDSLNDATEPIP